MFMTRELRSVCEMVEQPFHWDGKKGFSRHRVEKQAARTYLDIFAPRDNAESPKRAPSRHPSTKCILRPTDKSCDDKKNIAILVVAAAAFLYESTLVRLGK